MALPRTPYDGNDWAIILAAVGEKVNKLLDGAVEALAAGDEAKALLLLQESVPARDLQRRLFRDLRK